MPIALKRLRSACFTVLLLALLSPATLLAQNRLTNPAFDSGLAGWQPIAYNPTFQHEDADGSPHSGSASASVPGGAVQGGSALRQCVAVTPGETDDLSVRVKEQVNYSPIAYLDFFPSSDCTGSALTGYSIYSDPSEPNGQWALANRVVPAPNGAQSASIALAAGTSPQGGAATTSWDDIYFGPAAPSSCSPSANTLCLDDSPNDQRFVVVATYHTANQGGLSGSANAVSLNTLGIGQGGLFWFFSHPNPELLVKVHDACNSSSFFWVFVSAGTNAGVELYVADTLTGAVAYFHNPDLSPYPTIHDFLALPCN